jgi:hypothetical protein
MKINNKLSNFSKAFFLSTLLIFSLEEEIKEAVSTLSERKTTIQNMAQKMAWAKKQVNPTAKQADTEGGEALAIVFPETIRFSTFKDFFETKALENLYVKYGKQKADFSIGEFQMKPSFIEQLENFVINHQNLRGFEFITQYKGATDEEKRAERVARLKQFEWQLRYAHCFWAVASEQFKNKDFPTAYERVHFFASAYNFGFWKSAIDIQHWQQKKAFPYGIKYTGEQTNYGDVSVLFLNTYANKFLAP